MALDATNVIKAETVATIVSKVGLSRMFDLAIDRLSLMLSEHGAEAVDLKVRDGFVLESPHQGLLEWMPAIRHEATVAVKIVGYNPHNPVKYQTPTILSTLLAFDVATGHLRTVVDGTFATALRTGAASAVATRLLARENSSVLGLIGCGAQAVTQLAALSRVMDLERVVAWDVDEAARDSFAGRARTAIPIEIVPVTELEEVSDIICTATSVAAGSGPVLSGDRLKQSVHINSVGSDMPGKTELPLRLLRESLVCPDLTAQAVKEGECQQLTAAEIGPSLFELARQPDLLDSRRGGRTVYDSTGLALQDLMMVELFEELAAEFGLWEPVAIEAGFGDPRDPYAFLSSSGMD